MVDYRALEADHPGFSGVAGYQTSTVTISDRDRAERVTAKSVTGSYFPLLGQSPQLGRLFTEADDAGSELLAVLTRGYWTRRFGSDPGVLGRTLAIDGRAHTIVGVLEDVMGPLESDVAVFTAARWPRPRRKGPFFTTVLGRLRPDVPRAAALEALRATNARLFPIWKSSYQDDKATWGMLELKARVIGDATTTLLVVLAAVGCLLLIACANAINLLVARALHRSRELALRAALGASRGQLLQQLTVETALLAAAATVVAAEVALVAIRLVSAYGATYIPRIDEVELSWPAMAWLAALSVLSALLMLLGGALPVLRGSSSAAGLRARTAVGRPTGHRRSPGATSASRPCGRRVHAGNASDRCRCSDHGEPRSPVTRERWYRHRTRSHGRGLVVRTTLFARGGSTGFLAPRARAVRLAARCGSRRNCRRPAAERAQYPEQLRARRSSDAAGSESAALPLGRGVAGILQGGRLAARGADDCSTSTR